MRRWARVAGVLVLVAAGLVAAPASVGAADYGPVDPTLTDGAAGSLRDVVENDATAAGDVVLLQSGATYTLTCAGGGPMIHGGTAIVFRTVGGIPPAAIVQSCADDAFLEQPAETSVRLENVVVEADSPSVSPDCVPADPDDVVATWTTLRSDIVTTEELPTVETYRTRVVGVLPGPGGDEVRFDTTVAAPPGSAAFDEAVAAAGAALVPPARGVSAPVLVETSDATETSESTDFQGHTYTLTTTLAIGPGTKLVGPEQSVEWFVPDGCSSINYTTFTDAFYQRTVQPTLVHSATYVVAGLGVAPAFTG